MPVITTEVPLLPESGKKEIIVGTEADVEVEAGEDVELEVNADLKVKLWVELPDPFGVVTLIIPLEPLPTMTIILVGETTVKP